LKSKTKSLFFADGCEMSKNREHVFFGNDRLVRNRNGALNSGHRSAESLRLSQKGIRLVRNVVRHRGARGFGHRRRLRARGKWPDGSRSA